MRLEPDCKPNSVSRNDNRHRDGDHSSRVTVTRNLEQPTRSAGPGRNPAP